MNDRCDGKVEPKENPVKQGLPRGRVRIAVQRVRTNAGIPVNRARIILVLISRQKDRFELSDFGAIRPSDTRLLAGSGFGLELPETAQTNEITQRTDTSNKSVAGSQMIGLTGRQPEKASSCREFM